MVLSPKLISTHFSLGLAIPLGFSTLPSVLDMGTQSPPLLPFLWHSSSDWGSCDPACCWVCWGLKCQQPLALLWATLSPSHLSLAEAFVCTPWEENNPLAFDHTWIQPSIWHLEKWANSLTLLPGLKPEWMQLIFTALIRCWVSERRARLLEKFFKNRERKGKDGRKEDRQQERRKGRKRGRNKPIKRKESTEYLME